MYNKIKTIVTGYKIKKMTIGELEVKLTYNKKYTSIDPFAPLKGLKNEFLISNKKSLEHVDFRPCWEKKYYSLDQLKPTHEASFDLNNKNYKVKRYVTKFQQKPISIYTYGVGETVFAIFTRKYDYGQLHLELVHGMKEKYKLEGAANEPHFIKGSDYSFLLHQFGHSHSLIWKDQTELENCLSLVD